MKWTDFEAFVEETMKEENIAGMAVAVSRSGEIIYKKGFGSRNLETGEPVTPQTVFGIASVTKSFTALAIMKLAEQGKLQVTDPVVKHLPEFSVPGVDDMGSIKIHHLLSHTTGIPPMRRRQDIEGFAGHLEFIAQEDFLLLGKPGAYFSYCNDAFLLLGEIIERLTGETYRDYITKAIVEPLGMSNTTLYPDMLADFSDVSVPYVYNKEHGRLEEQPWPVLRNYEVGGGVRSCVTDLLKYGEAYTSNAIVPVSRSAKMYEPVYTIGRTAAYGYALKVTPNHAGVSLVEHGGGQPGVSANFGFVPEEDLVVAVLCNVTGVSAARIWVAAVNNALGLELSFTTESESVASTPLKDGAKYLGTYASAEGGKLVVTEGEGTLLIEHEGATYDLHYARDTVFFFNYRGQKVVRFHLDGEGEPWAAFAGLRMLRKTT